MFQEGVPQKKGAATKTSIPQVTTNLALLNKGIQRRVPLVEGGACVE